MIELGSILCGDYENENLKQFPFLGSYFNFNPKEGYRLIDEGVKLVEAAAAEGKGKPLSYRWYSQAWGAYHHDTHKLVNSGERGFSYHMMADTSAGQGNLKKAYLKKIEYAEKALDALKKGNIETYVGDDVDEFIKLYEEKAVKNAHFELKTFIDGGVLPA